MAAVALRVVDLFPAIDIRHGRVVRLSQGEATRQTVYGDDPVAVAERFVEQGARWIHVVDLDRAFGTGDNIALVRRIVARGRRARVRLQLGGGLRTLELVGAALELGVARVVIGTAAAPDPRSCRRWSRVGADRIGVGIDARDGFVAIRGWTETSSSQPRRWRAGSWPDGMRTLIYTDVARDGMLGGPDLEGARRLQATRRRA